MDETIAMKNKRAPYLAAIIGTCLSSFSAMAQSNSADTTTSDAQSQASSTKPAPPSVNEVTLGAVYVGGSNTNMYGRYNGFTTQGADLVGDFHLQSRDPWSTTDSFYYDFSGTNLDFQTGNRLQKGFSDSTYLNGTSNTLGPEAEISLNFGDQGTWALKTDYDAISYTGNVIDSIYTVTGTTATLNNNLPAWGGATNLPPHVGATTSLTTTQLSPAEQPFQVGTRRDIIQVLGEYLFDDWTFTSSVRHEHKEGTLEESLYETYGGEAFTLPIDFDTDRFDVSAGYNVPDLQALLQYSFMHFTDNNVAVTIPYPVSTTPLSASSGPYAKSGLYSLPPSNYASYITGMLGYNVLPQTRVTLNGRLGMEIQDSTFPANSADPNLSSTLGNPTYTWFGNLNGLNQGTGPETSPHAFAWVYQGNFAVTSNLATDLDGRASYNFDGRQVTMNVYQAYIGGSSPDATANTAVYALPQGWFNQTANLEATYNIFPESNTKLMVDYYFNAIDRTNAQVEHSVTNTESIDLSSMPRPDILARVTYEHADRNGTLVYGTAWGNLDSGTPAIYGTPSGAYYQAPMTSDSVIVRSTYAPQGSISVSLFMKYVNEHYNYPTIPNTAPSGDWTLVGYGEGIKGDDNLTVGPDISYSPSDIMKFHVYYTYERIFYDNLGNGACAESNTGLCAGSVGFFQNTYTSGTHTAGLSGEWQVDSKLKITEDYNFSYGMIGFGEFNGVQVPAGSVSQSYQNVVNYPNINSVMHQLHLTALYEFTSRITASLNVQYSMFHNNDWNDFTSPVQPTTNTGTAISILTPGYPPPSYNVWMIGTAMKVVL